MLGCMLGQVHYSSSTPFIGKLTLKFLEVSHTKHGDPWTLTCMHAHSPGILVLTVHAAAAEQ